ncbi:MAG: porin [Phycisphaerales bacterium JB039]
MRAGGMGALAAAVTASGVIAAEPASSERRAMEAELLRGAASQAAQAVAGPTLFGHMQVRYTANLRDAPPPGEEDFTQGFSMRAVRLGARGGSGDLSYFVLGDVGKATGVVILLDAYADWRLSEAWSLRAGQFKLPLVYEENVSDTKQLAADRSLATQTFNQDRSQGLQATYDNGDDFRGRLAFSSGIATKNTDFDSPVKADYAFSGRVDWKPSGPWSALDDFTSEKDGAQALRFGLFGHWQDGGSTGTTADTALGAAGADVQWERAGWNAFGAVTWAHTEPETGPSADDLFLTGHAGYRINAGNEVFARVSASIADDRSGLDPEDIPEILVGYNHYFDGQSAKLTLDAGLFTAPTTETLRPSDTEVGILPDEGDPQFVFRAQFQVVF